MSGWACPPTSLRLGGRTFTATDRVVMAVVNRTPDSFYDAGATFSLPAALAAVDRAVAEGADIVDLGGVKAGAGDPVDVAEERRRVVPLIAATRARHPDLVISVDTWRHEVAEAAAQAGADVVNDAWAGYDPQLVDVAARYGLGLVCSHTGGIPPRTVRIEPDYDDVVTAVRTGVRALVERALAARVRPDGLLIDPAHDFGKTTWHSLEVTRRLDELVATGWPVLVAVSRKDFVGETLGRPVTERLAGTLAVTAWCAAAGARVFRAHDVRATRDVVDMITSIQGVRPPAQVSRGLR